MGEASDLVRISAADLEETRRELTQLDEEAPTAGNGPFTVAFDGNRMSGYGGCNTYNVDFSLGEENPFAIEYGPLVATSRNCPTAVEEQASKYFDALGNAGSWRYVLGDLAIYHVEPVELPKRLQFKVFVEN